MKIKKAIFLSHTINEKTPLYGGKKSVIIKQIKSIKKGDACNAMHYSFPNHAGTHVDAPAHFIEKGPGLTDFIAEDFIFNKISLIKVKNIQAGGIIKSEDMGRIKDCQLLLIKTGFEKLRKKELYWKNSPALHPNLANHLKKNYPSIRAVGVDFISISNLYNRGLGRDAHKAFLGNNILLIEDMKLSVFKKIPNFILVAPLLVDRVDASPCTVIGIYN